MQGVFQQLHALNKEPYGAIPPPSSPQTPDPLNIINVALARQQAALHTGCHGQTCTDSTNLVNTLYQRHQTLLEQQQQRAVPGFESTDLLLQAQHAQHGAVHVDLNMHADHQELDQVASVSATQHHQQQSEQLACAGDTASLPAAESGQITPAQAVVELLPNSPSFQGDTVPDTPIAAAEAAAQEAAAEAAEGVTLGVEQEDDIQGVAVNGVDLVFDMDSSGHGTQTGTAVAVAVADTAAGQGSGLAINHHQV